MGMSPEEKILSTFRSVAVVGLSPKPDRPSHKAAAYLKGQGYKIIPVNPGEKEILGEPLPRPGLHPSAHRGGGHLPPCRRRASLGRGGDQSRGQGSVDAGGDSKRRSSPPR